MAATESKIEQLKSAINNYDVEKIKQLRDSGLDLTQITLPPYDVIPLAYAVSVNTYPRNNDQEEALKRVIDELLNAGIDINQKDSQHYAALHTAMDCGTVTSIVEYLLEKGADPNVKDPKGQTPLFYPWKTEKIELLLKHGADIDAKNNEGNTVLHNQIDEFKYDTSPANFPITFLLQKSPELVGKTNNQGQTPLHIAARLGNFILPEKHGYILGLLLAKGADPRAKDANGCTPLDILNSTNKPTLVKLLETYVPNKSVANRFHRSSPVLAGRTQASSSSPREESKATHTSTPNFRPN